MTQAENFFLKLGIRRYVNFIFKEDNSVLSLCEVGLLVAKTGNNFVFNGAC
jgi:hypothetical protein